MSIESALERFPVDVGRRVRDARVTRAWTLDELADRSGVSRRMIVNVEAGTTNASIATLLRLASALQVSLAGLVAPHDDEAVVLTPSAARNPVWRSQLGGAADLVASADTPDMLELWDWTLAPGEVYASDAHRPGTHELLHVISGVLDLTVGEWKTRLRAGDGASFAAEHPHTYANAGRRPLRFSLTVLEPSARVRP